MSTLFEEAKRLPVSQRIELVEAIWDSIADESPEEGALSLSKAELMELNRRSADHRADPETAIPWEEVRKKLFKEKA
ncbi:addiction module protein [Endothiovibrio diazotrophicus]